MAKSCKSLLNVERDVVAKNMIEGPGDLVRSGSDGNHSVGLAFLSFVVSLGLWAVADHEMSGFAVSPGEIFITAFGVAFPFRLTIAETLAADTPTIGRVVTYFGKPAYFSGFQNDGQAGDGTDTRNSQQIFEVGGSFQDIGQFSLQGVDLPSDAFSKA